MSMRLTQINTNVYRDLVWLYISVWLDLSSSLLHEGHGGFHEQF